MARGFRRKGEGEELRFTARLDALERATVAGLMDQVHDLLEPGDPVDEGGDDFSAIVAGLGMGVTVAPEDQSEFDASVARARPGPRAAAADRPTARTTRPPPSSAGSPRAGCAGARPRPWPSRAGVLRGEDKVRLSEAEARAFLTALTDVRLVLGERMGLRTDDDLDALEAAAAELDDDDPLGYALAIYDFLTWLQETLASAMLPR